MKKLFSILLLCFCFSATSQDYNNWVYLNGEVEVEDFNFIPPVTATNMSVVFSSGSLSQFSGGLIQAYVDGVPVSNASDDPIQENGVAGVAVIGTDGFCGCDLADSFEQIEFSMLINEQTIVDVDVYPPLTYTTNAFHLIDNDFILVFTIEGEPVEFGCTDVGYLEYNNLANIDDGSCEVIKVVGCTDIEACDYSSEANYDDGTCLYLDFEQSVFNACCLGNSITTICLLDESICSDIDIDCISSGCTQLWADNYDPFITQDDGSCFKEGCTSEWADNYDTLSTINDGSCNRLGCTSNWADNFDEDATINDGNCEYEIITQLAPLFDSWYALVNLQEGWNMFGCGCPEPIDAAEVLFYHTENIVIVKDNNGSVYMPEFEFNGIGELIPGAGYQIKLLDAIEGFSLCENYANELSLLTITSLQDEFISFSDSISILEDNIVSLQEENEVLQAFVDSVNAPPMYHVGDYAEGGIIFYLDETGEHGLVAAMEDLGQFEWGCYGTSIVGADGTAIGTGYQNTMDIVNQECETEDGGITAAQVSIDFENGGYSDWYLPSSDELVEMYNTIGNAGAEGNIGGFENNWYWPSSEHGSNTAWGVYFGNGGLSFNSKDFTFKVRVIRAF